MSRDETCPARNVTCNRCYLQGHYVSMCKSRNPGGATGRKKSLMVNAVEGDNEYAFSVGLGSGSEDEAFVDVMVNGVTIRNVFIDSGATCNVIDSKTWKDLRGQGFAGKLERTSKKLLPYGSEESLGILGKFTGRTEVNNRAVAAEFIVVDGGEQGLLGRRTAQKLGVLKLGPRAATVNAPNAEPPEVQKFPHCFQEPGKLKDHKVKIHIDETVPPVAQSPRRVPFSLRGKLEKKLDELVEMGVMEAVEGPTSWVSPIVIVPKPSGDIRLCVDMRRANEAIIRERHPIPTIDEVLQSMNGSTVFSKIDLKWGFHQLELEEDSRKITSFVTHKGLYRYKRLMFGISCAPEIYQHVIQQVLTGCEGAANIADDIIVHGRDMEDHDRKLTKVLEYLQKRGLTLNREKCQFRMPQLTFMGKVLSERGVGPTETKVEAVLKAREPENATEVRSFLGLVNFNARFMPNLATIAEPLRRLTKKDDPFKWKKAQQQAFDKLKKDLANTQTLAYFDQNAPTQVIADAGPVGLGAVLVQKQQGQHRVISYASRSLTDVERRYSQTEKEALALVWACERFHLYLYGVKFEIVTDHKPLEAIYSPRSKPSARIERWMLRLQPYTYKVKHIPGPKNIADSLSRLFKETGSPRERNVAKEYIRFVAVNAAPRAIPIKEIERKSTEDSELTEVRHCIRKND